MASLMWDDPFNLRQKMPGLLRTFEVPSWGMEKDGGHDAKGLAQAAEYLEILIDLLEKSSAGIERVHIPSGENKSWKSPRKLVAIENDTTFKLSIDVRGGFYLNVSFEDKNFHEYGLSFEELVMMIRSFAILRMSSASQ